MQCTGPHTDTLIKITCGPVSSKTDTSCLNSHFTLQEEMREETKLFTEINRKKKRSILRY